MRLEPLRRDHAEVLLGAVTERDTYGFTVVPGNRAQVDDYIAAGLARTEARQQLPFVQVRRSDDRVVGHTSLCNFRHREGVTVPYAVEIGWTWLAASAQRTGINTEAKLLLMTHAFETMGVARVDLETDSRNQRSWAAIERLGATFEGVLRNWQPSFAPGEEGRLRDTAMFSVTAAEWPTVKRRLQSLLA